MAEETTVVATEDEDAAFEAWLNEEDEEEEVQESVEKEYAKEDDRALKTAKETKQMFAKYVKEERVEKKVDSFLDAASDTEKELFAIFRKGDEDEKQLDRLIELVKTKANVAEGKFVSEEEIEEKAAEKAAEAVGPGPLRQGARTKTDPRAERYEKIRQGDVHATVEEFFEGDPIMGKFFGSA